MVTTSSRILDDIARLATDAAGAAQGVRREVETVVKTQIERLLRDLDVVTREEFEAVEAMAAKARREQAALEMRITELEAKLGEAKKTAPKRKAASGDRRRASTTATRRAATRKTKADETPTKDE